MYRYLYINITFFIFFISCADTGDKIINENNDYRYKSYVTKTGSSCGDNCIWSKYAITSGTQSAQKECDTGDCACVLKGNIYELCDKQYTENINYDHSINENEINNDNINVVYYNQYNNEYSPGSTCQNTSIAMVLSHFENIIEPDNIYIRWGKDYAQSPTGLNAVYTSYANRSIISTYTNATPEDLISSLNSGYIAIVHGYFTEYGHVIVVRGYDGERYYVNDPAGKWPECFKCGYNNSPYNGITSYSKRSFEKAVFTSDGYSYLPGWVHIVK